MALEQTVTCEVLMRSVAHLAFQKHLRQAGWRCGTPAVSLEGVCSVGALSTVCGPGWGCSVRGRWHETQTLPCLGAFPEGRAEERGQRAGVGGAWQEGPDPGGDGGRDEEIQSLRTQYVCSCFLFFFFF